MARQYQDLSKIEPWHLPLAEMTNEVSSSDFNRYDRNANTGGTYGHSATTIKAEQTIHHDAARPSHIVLPVIHR